MLSRPPSSPAIAILKPCPSAPIRFSTGTRQFSNITIAVGCDFQPSFFSCAPKESPGVPFSTTMQEMPRGPALAGAHHADIDVGDAAARDEGLGAVEHVMIAVAARARLQARGVRARVRLGQAIAREMLHGAELRQEALALRLAAERVDHPGRHVVDRDIGGGRGAALRQFLEDDRGVEPRQRRAADIVLHVDAAEAERRRLAQVSTGKISFSSQSRACGIISSRANCRAVS